MQGVSTPCPVDGGLGHLAKILVAGCPHRQLSSSPALSSLEVTTGSRHSRAGGHSTSLKAEQLQKYLEMFNVGDFSVMPCLFIPPLIYMSTDSMDIHCMPYYNETLLICFVALAIGNSFWLVPVSLCTNEISL